MKGFMRVFGGVLDYRKRVMVLDGETRKAIPVVRALAADGWWVAVASHKATAPARFSRHCRRFFPIASPSSPEYTDSVVKAAKKARTCFLFPLEDLSIQRIYGSQVERDFVVPLPPQRCYLCAFDKWKTIQLARSIGVACPRTVLLAERSVEDAVKEVGLPAVVKPRKGYGAHGVRLVKSAAQIREILRAQSGTELMLQEFIPHGGAGGLCALIPQKGEPAVFTFLRLREFPPSGGPSTLRIAVDLPEVQEQAMHLLKAINWRGLAMVEFRRHAATHEWFLMEINARVWGSIALAIAAGVNFPALALREALGETIHQVKWRRGTLCRWWFGDMLNLIASKRFLRLLFEPFAMPTFPHYDILSLNDPLPSVMMLFQTPLGLFNRAVQEKLWGRGW